jgi:hypothetical protein
MLAKKELNHYLRRLSDENGIPIEEYLEELNSPSETQSNDESPSN